MRDAARTASTVHATSDARAEEIAVICHELRNSLAVVRGAARLLSPPEGNASASARSLIERHAAQMSRHIEALLQPLRHDASNNGLILSRLDLRVVASHAADAIGPEIARRGHRLAVKLPKTSIWIDADGDRLEQAFLNLLINAAKYTPEGGDIALTMDEEVDRARVRIRDSGMGIEPRMLSRVFDMFVQAGNGHSACEMGRGIGLSVVRTVVEQHGGTVTATSAGLGLGSEFTVVLPEYGRELAA